eukprot:2087131-Ditylum_brightwellii.AAC.1
MGQIWQADTCQKVRRKPHWVRTPRRVKWITQLPSDEEDADDGDAKIDDSEVCTPSNPNVVPAEKRVYNLQSMRNNTI